MITFKNMIDSEVNKNLYVSIVTNVIQDTSKHDFKIQSLYMH